MSMKPTRNELLTTWMTLVKVKETYYQAEMRPVLEQILREIKPDLVHVAHLINHTSALLEVTQKI